MSPVVIALPIDDRPRSHAFYRDGFGFTAVGPIADDGVPEPLQFALSEGCHLMLVPRGGFGWVTAGQDVAAPGTSECLLSVAAGSPEGVDAAVARARDAGATVLTPAGEQPWGYAGTVADPDGHAWMIVV